MTSLIDNFNTQNPTLVELVIFHQIRPFEIVRCNLSIYAKNIVLITIQFLVEKSRHMKANHRQSQLVLIAELMRLDLLISRL